MFASRQQITTPPMTTSMPYNTRRKSLSLADLGVQVPKRSRNASHPVPPSTIMESEEPPVKKSKRSHSSNSPPPGLMSPPRTTTIRMKETKPTQAAQLSPPPSPTLEGANKVDLEGINDNIVASTIQQLESTGNRPHLVKELVLALAGSLRCVEKSANPCALVSSRLTAYLNRSWPAISPCPLAKDLSPVHPRRLYFYLTTSPHQPIPEQPPVLPELKRNISPPQSSVSAADEDERFNRHRTAMSPSPEVDLSSPELDENIERPPTPCGQFSGRDSISRASRSSSMSHNKRTASPQLEREERDFKQTASQLYEQAQIRRHSQQDDVKIEQAEAVAAAEQEIAGAITSTEESEESAALKHCKDAAALFGHVEHLRLPSAQMEFSSPVIPPLGELKVDATVPRQNIEVGSQVSEAMSLDVSPKDFTLPDPAFTWDSLQSLEDIELAELDDMFDAY